MSLVSPIRATATPAVDVDAQERVGDRRANDRPLTLRQWPAWRWGVAALMVAATVFATWQAWVETITIGWRDEESSHILLVPVAFLWLLWVRRSRLARCVATPSKCVPGLVLLGVGWLMWSTGYFRQSHTLSGLGPVVMAVGALVSVTGRDLLVKFAPAFLVLVFLVHVAGERRQQVAQPLQTATAAVAAEACQTLGMDVTRQGNLLNINGVDVAVAEACNGMRMVFTLILASYVFAFVTPLRTWVRVLILALSPVTALVANIIRVIPTVWMFGYAPHEWAELIHTLGGYVMLVVAFLLLTGVVSLLRWAMIPTAPMRLVAG